MLREFLLSHRGEIISRVRAKVAERLAPRATETELDGGIPVFVDQLIATLGPDGPSGQLGARAAKHGSVLFDRGFTVAQVVHDYGGVCKAVTELAAEIDAPISADEFRTFNGCLDDAIAGAVTEYTRRLEASTTDLGTERLGSFAHEVRNALGAAMMSFEILQKGGVGIGGATASVLGRSLKRLSRLVDSSLVAVRLDSGAQATRRVTMRQILEQVEVEAAMEASAKGMSLVVTPVEPDLAVNVDSQLLVAALANLLQNAFKFSRPGGHVTLRTSAAAGRVLIDVEDECGGLGPGPTEHLFIGLRPERARTAAGSVSACRSRARAWRPARAHSAWSIDRAAGAASRSTCPSREAPRSIGHFAAAARTSQAIRLDDTRARPASARVARETCRWTRRTEPGLELALARDPCPGKEPSGPEMIESETPARELPWHGGCSSSRACSPTRSEAWLSRRSWPRRPRRPRAATTPRGRPPSSPMDTSPSSTKATSSTTMKLGSPSITFDLGVLTWVPPGSPYYGGLVGHWRAYGVAYHRWYGHGGYGYRGYHRR